MEYLNVHNILDRVGVDIGSLKGRLRTTTTKCAFDRNPLLRSERSSRPKIIELSDNDPGLSSATSVEPSPRHVVTRAGRRLSSRGGPNGSGEPEAQTASKPDHVKLVPSDPVKNRVQINSQAGRESGDGVTSHSAGKLNTKEKSGAVDEQADHGADGDVQKTALTISTPSKYSKASAAHRLKGMRRRLQQQRKQASRPLHQKDVVIIDNARQDTINTLEGSCHDPTLPCRTTSLEHSLEMSNCLVSVSPKTVTHNLQSHPLHHSIEVRQAIVKNPSGVTDGEEEHTPTNTPRSSKPQVPTSTQTQSTPTNIQACGNSRDELYDSRSVSSYATCNSMRSRSSSESSSSKIPLHGTDNESYKHFMQQKKTGTDSIHAVHISQGTDNLKCAPHSSNIHRNISGNHKKLMSKFEQIRSVENSSLQEPMRSNAFTSSYQSDSRIQSKIPKPMEQKLRSCLRSGYSSTSSNEGKTVTFRDFPAEHRDQRHSYSADGKRRSHEKEPRTILYPSNCGNRPKYGERCNLHSCSTVSSLDHYRETRKLLEGDEYVSQNDPAYQNHIKFSGNLAHSLSSGSSSTAECKHVHYRHTPSSTTCSEVSDSDHDHRHASSSRKYTAPHYQQGDGVGDIKHNCNVVHSLPRRSIVKPQVRVQKTKNRGSYSETERKTQQCTANPYATLVNRNNNNQLQRRDQRTCGSASSTKNLKRINHDNSSDLSSMASDSSISSSETLNTQPPVPKRCSSRQRAMRRGSNPPPVLQPEKSASCKPSLDARKELAVKSSQIRRHYAEVSNHQISSSSGSAESERENSNSIIPKAVVSQRKMAVQRLVGKIDMTAADLSGLENIAMRKQHLGQHMQEQEQQQQGKQEINEPELEELSETFVWQILRQERKNMQTSTQSTLSESRNNKSISSALCQIASFTESNQLTPSQSPTQHSARGDWPTDAIKKLIGFESMPVLFGSAESSVESSTDTAKAEQPELPTMLKSSNPIHKLLGLDAFTTACHKDPFEESSTDELSEDGSLLSTSDAATMASLLTPRLSASQPPTLAASHQSHTIPLKSGVLTKSPHHHDSTTRNGCQLSDHEAVSAGDTLCHAEAQPASGVVLSSGDPAEQVGGGAKMLRRLDQFNVDQMTMTRKQIRNTQMPTEKRAQAANRRVHWNCKNCSTAKSNRFPDVNRNYYQSTMNMNSPNKNPAMANHLIINNTEMPNKTGWKSPQKEKVHPGTYSMNLLEQNKNKFHRNNYHLEKGKSIVMNNRSKLWDSSNRLWYKNRKNKRNSREYKLDSNKIFMDSTRNKRDNNILREKKSEIWDNKYKRLNDITVMRCRSHSGNCCPNEKRETISTDPPSFSSDNDSSNDEENTDDEELRKQCRRCNPKNTKKYKKGCQKDPKNKKPGKPSYANDGADNYQTSQGKWAEDCDLGCKRGRCRADPVTGICGKTRSQRDYKIKMWGMNERRHLEEADDLGGVG